MKYDFLVISFFCFCHTVSEKKFSVSYGNQCRKVIIDSGVEDFVYDKKNQRLIVSNHDRRNWKDYGEIYSFSFMRHASNPLVRSPSVVYRVNPLKKSQKIIYSNSGEETSAASTAQEINGKLFISQVFENYLPVCE